MTFIPSFQIDNVQVVVPISLSSLAPAEVEDNGGAALVVTGSGFSSERRYQIDVVVSGTDYPCYAGTSGEGAGGSIPKSATEMHAATPPLPKGGPYDVKVTDLTTLIEVTMFGVLTVHNRNFKARDLAMRQLLPPFLKTGPRTLLVTDPLA